LLPVSEYLITGVTRGIGRAVVDLLADHSIILVGRDADLLRAISDNFPSARPVVVDLAHPEDIERSFGSEGVPGRLDGIIHIAGVSQRATLSEMPLEGWSQLFTVNVFAVAELTRVMLPALRAARGMVLLANSGAGLGVRGRGGAAYAASKYALRAFADGLRIEEPDLRVTSVFLGRVATEMQRQLRAYEGGPFRPDDYLAPEAVAESLVRLLTLPPEMAVPEVTLFPR
jgi:NADP-dependent 3-hydroxy acid dehydrogenase YdfG